MVENVISKTPAALLRDLFGCLREVGEECLHRLFRNWGFILAVLFLTLPIILIFLNKS